MTDYTVANTKHTFQRAVYSIKPKVLARFNALYRARERSKLVERFLDTKVREKEHAFVEAARLIETDPSLGTIRDVSDDVDALTSETLRTL
jgi:hypothetical protein